MFSGRLPARFHQTAFRSLLRALAKCQADATRTAAHPVQAHADMFAGARGLIGEQRLEWDEVRRLVDLFHIHY